MKTPLAILAFVGLAAGCNQSASSTVPKFDSAEGAAQYVNETNVSAATFTLTISDRLTVAGKPDSMGLGMALVLDAILAKGFEPDGFVQESGYRAYRYRRMKP
jgi:hypothetical protein